jgi:hypothetical protein
VDTLFGQPGHGEGRTDHEESLKPSQNENVAPHKGTDGGAGAVTARASDLVVDGVSIKLTILDTPGGLGWVPLLDLDLDLDQQDLFACLLLRSRL